MKTIRQSVLELEVMGSMRAVMSAGIACDRDNIAAYNCSYLAINNKRAFSEALYILMNGTGVGFSCERQEVNKLPTLPDTFKDVEDVIVVGDSKLGWAKAFKKLLSSLWEGDIPKIDYSKVRPAGARLKTFGGRASGPEPLKRLFDFCIALFKEGRGRKLTSIEVHDILCMIGEIVVVGGVRRSALISLSNLTDRRMREAKMGAWYIDNAHRGLANNSVAYTEKPDAETFMEEWLSLVKSKSGERGIFNRVAAQEQASRWGRRDSEHSYGVNPCFTGDMELLTTQGYRKLRDLCGTSFENQNYLGDRSEGKVWSNGVKDIVEVSLKNKTIRCTPNHVFMLSDGSECEAKDLKGKRLRVPYALKTQPYSVNDFKAGFLLGDGALTRLNSDSHQGMEVYIGQKDGDICEYFGVESVGTHYLRENKALALEYSLLGKETFERELPWNVSYDMMMGLWAANGCVIKSGKRLALKTASKKLAEQVKDWLEDVEISAYITTNKPTKVKFSNGEYLCKQSYDVNIVGIENIVKFAESIGFVHKYKQQALEQLIESVSPFVRSVHDAGQEEVFDFTEPKTHWGVINGVVVHNCAEILLRDKQFCNLTEVVVRAEDTYDSLSRKVRLATILGTIQSTLTNFQFLSEEWKRNTEEERLLGVSLTGIMDNSLLSGKEQFKPLEDTHDGTLPDVLEALRFIARKTNEEYAKQLGVPASVAITCGKPSGTVSQLVDCSSGIHARHASYYIRRIRMDKKDPIYTYLKDKAIPVEDEVHRPDSTAVFSFPMKAPEGAVTRNDMSAIEQMEIWLIYKKHWCEHTQSVTITVKDDEWPEVGAWVWKHFDEISGISFLPHSNHTYQQAPYEDLTKEEYESMLSTFPNDITWEDFIELEDNTEGSQTLSCTGGSCEI